MCSDGVFRCVLMGCLDVFCRCVQMCSDGVFRYVLMVCSDVF